MQEKLYRRVYKEYFHRGKKYVLQKCDLIVELQSIIDFD